MILIRRTTYVDVQGNSRTAQLLGTASTFLIQSAVLTVSNADYALESEAELFANPTPTPVNAQYQSVLDSATLFFQTSAGTTVQITIPAPRASIFLADGETVNPASVAGVTTACIGVLCDTSGNVVTSYLTGVRARSSS